MQIGKFIGIGSGLLTLCSVQAQETPSPNLIIIFPDQLRASSVGYSGMEPVKTPNLDRFAGESVNLTQAASNYPVCSPFRAMLMSGQYPFKNGVFGNCHSITAPKKCELRADAVCWSDILVKNGYSLGYIGKWHLDAPNKPYVNCGNNRGSVAWNEWCSPERRHGFQYWYAYGTYDLHTNPLYWATDSKRNDFKNVGEYGPKHEIDRAIEFLKNTDGKHRKANQPFGLVISMNPPHTGYEYVPQKYRDLYNETDVEALAAKFPQIPPKNTPMGKFFRQKILWYYAQCTAVDEQFGRLMDVLKTSGLDQNTVVLFTSDHGDMLGAHNVIGKNCEYEESMHIPFLVRMPKKIKPHQNDLLISTPDIPATLLGLLGFENQIPKNWDGRNLAQNLINPKAGNRPNGQLYLFLTDGWEADGNDYSIGRRGWRNQEWTYVVTRFKDKPETHVLFNRKTDPFQLKDVSAQFPEKSAELHHEMNIELVKINPEWRINTP